MHGIIQFIKHTYSNLIFLLIALVVTFSLLVDGINFKKQGLTREHRIARIISYSYIAIGILLFVMLRIS